MLYSFRGAPDGDTPLAELVENAHGNFYGTTKIGGTANLGTVFELKHDPAGTWHERVIYSFTGKPDGAEPEGGLIIDASGALYGTTLLGGAAGLGTVFKLVP